MSIAQSASRSFSRSLATTGVFLRTQIWIWPIVAAILLAVVGLVIRGVVERSVKQTMAENLQTILNADVAALELWFESQKDNVRAAVADRDILPRVQQLVDIAAKEGATAATLAQHQQELRHELQPWLDAHDYAGYAIIDAQHRVLASNQDELIGKDNLPIPPELFQRLDAGQVIVTPPVRSLALLPDKDGQLRAGLPTMFAVAPIRNAQKQVIAALGLRIRPERDFTRILLIASAGKTGETYAFNREGTLISQSRFDEQLKDIGLLVDEDGVSSILNLQLRDPGVDMTRGHRPAARRKDQPLTRMAAAATGGQDGISVTGFRDYRGVPVISAWRWLKDYDFGVATKVDVAEAFAPLYILRYAFWGLFALLVLGAVAIFVYSILVSRLQRQARVAALAAKELGQYKLEEKIGAGGMGTVYRGRHAMLRRPTAVKLLDPEKTNDATAARFEREVQLTAQLNHPNTIAIFDYGRTPEGIFYYAMEYLDGINLDKLVVEHGPQPAGRVIHLLRQLCGSLNEAHGISLIHRDIKPANIIVSARGGEYDVIKLLDFGLVKAIDSQKQSSLTSAGSFTGTPLYLSPEGIESPDTVDARSDLYAVGAVGYFLLTGKPLFDATSLVDVLMHQVNTSPMRPSERLGQPIDAGLEQVITDCLRKDPRDRPASAAELARRLAACAAAGSWTDADAESWWRQHYAERCPTMAETPAPSKAADTATIAATMILDSRVH